MCRPIRANSSPAPKSSLPRPTRKRTARSKRQPFRSAATASHRRCEPISVAPPRAEPGALSPAQDEECARAGIAAFNATTTVNERSSVATLASAPKTASAQESSMTDREIRAALNQHWAASDANDFELEHQIYREDAVLEYPQSGERIRGRGNIPITRTLQPSKT